MKLLLTIVFLSISFGVTATDTFDQSTGNLLIPVVIVGDQKYTNVLVTVDQLVSFGGFEQPAEKSVSTVRPDTYDLRRGQLIVPSVIVGDKEYRNLRITVKDVISYDGMGVKVADSGFNGEWYPEPYSLFVAEDLPQSVREGIAKTLDAGVELWGNFGPMEYWVLGTDSKAALKLQNLYCNQRVALQHQTNNSVRMNRIAGGPKELIISIIIYSLV